MRRWSGERVMITQGGLFHIAGSEVATFEIAQYFAENGAEVIVATYGVSDAWKQRFESQGNVRVFRIDDPKMNELIRAQRPSLAWIHHHVIPEALVRDPKDITFVFHHMSAFVPQEFALEPTIEAALADAVVFPAREALEAQRRTGLLERVDPSRLRVLGNPAPDRFGGQDRRCPDRLESVLVVSNHAPDEVVEAVRLLGSDVRVKHVGEQAGRTDGQKMLTPEDLASVDAVITIGKTVQYALLGAVPVYCYDHFGGPGWLSRSTFDAAREANFSGRGFSKKTARMIADELINGYASACAEAKRLRDEFAEVFTLSSVMERLFDQIVPRPKAAPDELDIVALLARQEVSNGLTNALEARIQTVAYLTGLNRQLEDAAEARASKLNEIENSRAYRLVKRMIAVLPKRSRSISR